MRAFLAGISYFAVIFALGFALGTVRVLAIAPRLGETAAVIIELPIMLAASWWVCGRLLHRLGVQPKVADRLTMGGTAFVLLMLAEFGVSVFAFGRTPGEHLATYGSASALLGLTAQIAFAAMPLVRRGTLPSVKSPNDQLP